jgi:Tfp pilus assembly protein PilF
MANYRTSRYCVLFSLALAACAPTRPPHDDTRPQAGQDRVDKAVTTLLEGIRLYERGDFKAAIATLNVRAMQAAPDAIRLEALKYTAFSYCVMENYAACRHAFDQSLAIDRDFDLRKSERSHPMWGPVFDDAKTASEQSRADGSFDQDRERWRGIDLWRAR